MEYCLTKPIQSLAADAPLRAREVMGPVPDGLEAYGPTLRASVVGDLALTPIVLLGGISANRFPLVTDRGAPGWWPGLTGIGAAADPLRHCIIGVDFAADESGASAPTTHDQARIVAAALDLIGIDRPVTIIGASYGGMVALALADARPELVERLVIISANAVPHPAATAARELQRRVVALGLAAGRGADALAIARGLAMLTYRTAEEFSERFEGGIETSSPLCQSAPGAYLDARGRAFLNVMSPGRFLSLSASIDRHRVDPSTIKTPALLIGAESDLLVPPTQLRALAATLGGPVKLHLQPSLVGHDMFLKDAAAIGEIVRPFLNLPR
jgi:homoserine O-acetyltransferase